MPEEGEQSAKPPVIIIKRRKAGHAGHHGGAWKVAYADFVTAMMALFIVLWLMSSDKEVKESISAYFNNPSGPGKLTGTAAAGFGNSIEVKKEDMEDLRKKIQQALLSVPDFRKLKDNVEITITSDGLRIELLETEAGMFFESGRGTPTHNGAELMARLAGEMGKLPNQIFIEGHTDSKPYSSDGAYSNWELSTDRANSARRLMEEQGLRPDQIGQVRGFADRHLRRPQEPENASNRRISVIVQYQFQTPKEAGAAAEHGTASPPAGEHGPAAGEQPGAPAGQVAPGEHGAAPPASPPAGH